MTYSVSAFMEKVAQRSPNEPEFHQAVHEVIESIHPILDEYPAIRDNSVLERMVEPERVIMFRVPWVDDNGDPIDGVMNGVAVTPLLTTKASPDSTYFEQIYAIKGIR